MAATVPSDTPERLEGRRSELIDYTCLRYRDGPVQRVAYFQAKRFAGLGFAVVQENLQRGRFKIA